MTSTVLDAVTRVVIISDTHGYLHPEIHQLINQSDLVIHAGDIGDARVIDSLFPASGEVVAVRGNNDLSFLWPATNRSQLCVIYLAAIFGVWGMGELVRVEIWSV